MGSRRHGTRRAKIHFSYTLAEVAELYGVHRQTVRHWLGKGLNPLDDGRPILIHGSELNRFHSELRESQKRPCRQDELYCLGCKKPRRPAGSLLNYRHGRGSTGVVVGICPECDRIMRQNVNAERLARLKAKLVVTTRPDTNP